MLPSCFYFIWASLLLSSAFLLLVVILCNNRLRTKFKVFAVKFVVDICIATLLIALGCLDRDVESQCKAAMVLLAAVPFVQSILLLSEVFDWWLATFRPIYFHHANTLSRSIPYCVGLITAILVISLLVILEITASPKYCSPGKLSVICDVVYHISITLVVIALCLLVVLLRQKLHSTFNKSIIFHIVVSTTLLMIPLIIVLVLNYSNRSNAAIFTGDLANLLVATYAMSHSFFFVYNHEDVRQVIRSNFNKILPKSN